MKSLAISMIMILVLSTLSSGTNYVFAESVPENFESTPVPKIFTINLTEKIGFTETKKQFDKPKYFSVSLQEKIDVKNNPANLNFILIKHDSDRKTILERIFDQQLKLKNKESKLLQLSSPSTLIYHEESTISYDSILIDSDYTFSKLYSNLNNLIPNIFESEKIIHDFIIANPTISIQNDIELFNDHILDPKNPILLILLIPFAGFVLIRYDNEQTKFYQIKKFFTFTFIVILVSSAVITPMSISSSYWGYAYGEIDNSTDIISQIENQEVILENNTNISEITNDFLELDDLEIPTSEIHSTQSNNEMSMSDILSISLTKFLDSALSVNNNDSFIDDSNMSMSDILSISLTKFLDSALAPNSDVSSVNDSDMSFTDILSVTLSSFSSNTTALTGAESSLPDSISISDKIDAIFTPGFTIDDATVALPFDLLDNSTISGDAQIGDANSLELDGNKDFVQLPDNSTNNLQSFVIGAWVKPDYSQGSQEFTVVSKEKSFSLSVDNQPSSHAAKFSIFDGIKWSEIHSNSQIPEEWTHIVASFNNQTLNIYINGEIAGTKQIDGILSLSFDGQLETVDIDSISSDSSIVVGAYMTTKSGILVPNNMFSGMIDDVALFDSAISETQIDQLYSSGIDSHTTQTKSLDDIIREMEIEAGIYVNSINQTIQAQISISDSVSYIHTQAQNDTNPLQAQNDTNSIQAQISISDSVSYIHTQAQNTTLISIVVPEISPILTPVKETFTISEDAEIIFEFYDESEAMAQDLENLDVSIETAENDIDSTLNSSPLDDIFGLFVLPIPEADAAKDDGTSIKAKIKQIQKQIKQIKKSETVSEAQLDAIKDKIKLLMEQIENEIKETKKQKKIDKLNSVLAKFEKIINKNQKQKDNWIEDKETITTEVYDANNNKVELDVTFEKQREGKYNIKIDPTNAKPGIYKIKTILNINGKQFINESEFSWGLVSVNSVKSIYKPTEVAEFEIVVLNGTGAPVCPANILMQITDPNSSSTILTSDDIYESSCGLYLTNYPTTVTGNYTINVQANTGNGIVNFATYFTVLDNYDYDIIRNTDSKIDPFNNPNDNDVEIDITSFVGDQVITIKEFIPSSFGIFNTDATVETVGDKKILTWVRTPQNGLVDTIGYSYSVPLITPELYSLGQIQINHTGTQTFTEARPWFVAIDPAVLVESLVTTSNDRWQDSGKRTVAVNGSHVYSFYISNTQNLEYTYSTDGGLTWPNSPVSLESDSLSYVGISTWYEPDTPGLTDEIIHIAAMDSGSDQLHYIKFDPTDQSIITPRVQLNDTKFGSLVDSNDLAITVGTNGDIYVGVVDGLVPEDPNRVVVCTEAGHSCESTTDWVSTEAATVDPIWGTDDGNDGIMMMPLANGDILLISENLNHGNEIRSKVYDQSADDWDASWTTIESGIEDNSALDHPHSAAVEKSTNDVYLSGVDGISTTTTGASTIGLYRYSSGTWTSPGTLPDLDGITAGEVHIDSSLGFDEATSTLYAVYLRGTDDKATDVFYKSYNTTSDTWGTEKQITDSTSEYRGVSINSNSEELLFANFFDGTTGINDLLGGPVFKRPLLKDSLSIFDTLSSEIAQSVTLSETLTPSDAIEGAITVDVTLTETLTLADTVTADKTKTFITLTEILNTSENILPSNLQSITLTETLSLSDVIDSAKREPGDDPDARPLSVRILTGTLPSTGGNKDITISPALEDESKTFTMCSFNHGSASSNNHRKTFRAWELTSDTNLRIYQSNINGPTEVDYVCNVVEWSNAATVLGETSSFTYTAPGSSTVTTSLSGTYDLDETMEWHQGHHHDASESSIGNEELERVRLTSSTQWEWDVDTAPGSGPQSNYIGVFDWNNLDVNVQRGQTSIASGQTTKTLVAGTDFDETERTQSLLFASFKKTGAAAGEKVNVAYIHATIESITNNLIFERNTSDSDSIDINWTLVELPEDYAKIRHGTHTQADGTSNDTFDLSGGDVIENTGRAFVIGTVCTPFGCGTGSGSSTTTQAIDRIQATLELDDANTIRVIRGDGTGSFTVGYQTIEFLPKRVVLTEALSISDNTVTQNTGSVTLSETLTLSDITTTNLGRSTTLTETLTPSDVVSTTAASTVTLSETLTPSDVVSTTAASTVTLSETLTPSDVISTTAASTVTLSETLTPSDDFTFSGTIKIRSVDDDLLISGASYTISPNPSTGTGSLIITDNNSLPDANGTSGEVRILNVPSGDYEIIMTGIPTGYVVKINETTASLCCDEYNPLKIFSLRSDTVDLSQSDVRVGVSSPSLNQTSLNKMTGFSAIVVKGTTETSITKSNDLPPQITAGVNNSTAKTSAVSLQKNIKYVKDWSIGTKGSVVQEGLKLPKYYLPTNKSLTTVIPAVVSQESTTHQMISTPAFNKVTPGQQMILPIESKLIPSFGGVSKLDITSKNTSSTTGDYDWIVIEVDDNHISSTTLADSSIDRDLELEIGVKYRYEEDTVGFNWGISSNFASDPIMTVLVPKPTSTDIITLANGCRDLQVHTLVGGVWTSGIDSILSNIPSTTNTDFCEVEISSVHYSNKAISSKRSSSTGAGTGGLGSTSTGGGGGTTGVGASASGASVGFGGILSTPLAINEVSYDKCNENMARILVSSDADVPPSVKLATSKSGVVYATLAEVQPYEDLNKLTAIDRYLYEVPISSDESFLMIVVTEEKGTTKNVVQASIKLLSCEGTTVIVELPEDELPEISTGIPRIFDATVQIANGTRYSAELESEYLYIDNQDLTVSAIIDSITPLQRVELRSITMGQTEDQYIGINMNIDTLLISNSTYLVSGIIPSFVMNEPGMKYWLHIIDENDNRSESKHYSIGVKPTTVPDILVEMDIPNIIPSGSLIKPELYIFNDDEPSYGIVSLIVDGKVVAKKSQIFGIGQTQVIFNWNTPNSDGYSTLDLQGRVDLYDDSTVTSSAKVSSHPRTIAISAYDMESLQVIEKDGQVLADPALIYASNSVSDLRFRVTDPQGQCIIGGTNECLIQENTIGKRGGLESIPYGDQILRVRYSGADNALERFSITSIDPITGQWNVSLETEDEFIQQAHAIDDTLVKVKYRYHSEIMTVKSQQ